MIRLDVVRDRGATARTWPGWTWVVKQRGKGVVRQATTKVFAVRAAAEYAMELGVPVTVKIHRVDGKIQSERTYPRRSDPRRRKG